MKKRKIALGHDHHSLYKERREELFYLKSLPSLLGAIMIVV